jgi:hypothetical protein
MKNSLFVMAVFMISLASVNVYADTVTGTLVDQRGQSDGGYIAIQSERGYFAFDESTISPALMEKVQACLNRVSVATFQDMGMLDELVDVRCN